MKNFPKRPDTEPDEKWRWLPCGVMNSFRGFFFMLVIGAGAGQGGYGLPSVKSSSLQQQLDKLVIICKSSREV